MTKTRRPAAPDSANGGPPAVAAGRDTIARIDGAIVRLIARRVGAGGSIAMAKRAAGLPVFDPGQEARVVRRAAELARKEGLPEENVRNVFWRLAALTRRQQQAGADRPERAWRNP